jgi:hypothetical protein
MKKNILVPGAGFARQRGGWYPKGLMHDPKAGSGRPNHMGFHFKGAHRSHAG